MSKSVRRVLKNSVFQTFGSLGITGLNFLLMLGYAHTLGPGALGSLVTSQAQVLVWSLLVDLGLSHSLISALTVAEGRKQRGEQVGYRARDILFRVLALRLVGATIGFCFVWAFAGTHPGTTYWQDMAFAPYLFALSLQQTAVALAMHRHRQLLAVGAQFFGVLVTVALALWLAMGGAEISWLLLAQSWGGFLCAGIILWAIWWRRRRAGDTKRMKHRRTGHWGKRAWIELGMNAWPFAITFAVFVLWQRMDQIAVSHWLGLEAAGQYALAVRIVGIPILLAAAVSFALFPDLQRLGRDAPEKVAVALSLFTKIIWRFGIVLAALVLVALGLVISPLVPKFQQAIHLLPFFVPGVWAYWWQSVLVNALFGRRMFREVVIVHILAISLYLPCLVVLTKQFGLMGTISSFNIFCLLMALGAWWVAKANKILLSGQTPFSPFTEEERSLLDKALWARWSRRPHES
jgi:O-antigen/teichoic acid export membrane protein